VVDVLLILDGASEPLGPAPTSLERARTPALDALAREGALSRLRTIAPGLPAGSEAAIPALLGWMPPAPVDRGALEAAARGIELGAGQRAWRVDVLGSDGRRGADGETVRAATSLASGAPAHTVRRIGGHRLLVTGAPPLPAAARAAGLRVWPAGLVPPRILDDRVVVVAAAGAAAGCARLLGARVVIPPGATGGPDTDLQAKAAAALAAIDGEARRVVVHVGAADEAAHEHDAAGKVAALERMDAELVAPLARAVHDADGSLVVCPDHGCDPVTGAHDDAPVPCLRWPDASGPTGRLTERRVHELAVVELDAAVAA
jgi:2,3-bisphosphoglycerate-independent phosphoglycerate mutase